MKDNLNGEQQYLIEDILDNVFNTLIRDDETGNYIADYENFICQMTEKDYESLKDALQEVEEEQPEVKTVEQSTIKECPSCRFSCGSHSGDGCDQFRPMPESCYDCDSCYVIGTRKLIECVDARRTIDDPSAPAEWCPLRAKTKEVNEC